ncbi:MAG: hypothetical protein R3E76_16325 [Planctomycetota bacterium]
MEFRQCALQALSVPAVVKELRERHAVVLEQLANGGGATNWYVCKHLKDLERLAAEVRPGSIVTFFFKEQLKLEVFPGRIRAIIEATIKHGTDCIVGSVRSGVRVENIEYIDYPEEIDELFDSLQTGETILVGPFPPFSSESGSVPMVTIPDEDGVVRDHAY